MQYASIRRVSLYPHRQSTVTLSLKEGTLKSRAPRPPLAPAHEDARAQHLVRLRRGGLMVPVTMLAVGADAVAKLHAQRAVSERGRVGAAERAGTKRWASTLFVHGILSQRKLTSKEEWGIVRNSFVSKHWFLINKSIAF